jgi:hypothetical protein
LVNEHVRKELVRSPLALYTVLAVFDESMAENMPFGRLRVIVPPTGIAVAAVNLKIHVAVFTIRAG